MTNKMAWRAGSTSLVEFKQSTDFGKEDFFMTGITAGRIGPVGWNNRLGVFSLETELGRIERDG